MIICGSINIFYGIYYTVPGHDAEFDFGDDNGRGVCRLASRSHRPRQRVGFDTSDGMALVAEIQM